MAGDTVKLTAHRFGNVAQLRKVRADIQVLPGWPLLATCGLAYTLTYPSPSTSFSRYPLVFFHRTALVAGRLVCRMPELSPAVRATMARYGITDREMEYLQLVLRPEEPSAEEMAEHMSITVGTMDKHRSSLYLRLGVHSRLELLFKAVEVGLVPCVCSRLGLAASGATSE